MSFCAYKPVLVIRMACDMWPSHARPPVPTVIIVFKAQGTHNTANFSLDKCTTPVTVTILVLAYPDSYIPVYTRYNVNFIVFFVFQQKFKIDFLRNATSIYKSWSGFFYLKGGSIKGSYFGPTTFGFEILGAPPTVIVLIKGISVHKQAEAYDDITRKNFRHHYELYYIEYINIILGIYIS